ncbi:hypothetical protein [Syntrophomonas wolfei]|uniref:Uncharacterized protein n=1 Tax=Syntrophomonas wolfei subsp. wolfei (strain DSM 2245B / Goettingen) TaxID=335541 RepID=Q0AUT9_SYNWW|nr:hypothetical protein [Syntrophomonas wolfei]ABI69515.1 hypothetical protein Swol_2224 [Syntrophomonas wolfei subsp. wolfei str. Goettingen G311]
MNETDNLQIELKPYNEAAINTEYDLDRIIFDLDSQIELLSSQADNLDYLVSVASGVLCSMLDILWVGEFSLERGRGIASDKIDSFVTKTAKMLGCKNDDLESAVKFLEKKFPIPSDGNTPDFGGGLQHHLRDFAHHPTIVGLMFSLLTQFTYKSYGTDTSGSFKIVDVPEVSRAFIGDDVPSKILFGTITWFFHLVSDVAGSSSSVGKSGGTGIPGPMLALAKELSVLPIFKNMNVSENSLSEFLSKLFNGTLLAKHDENGKIIKETVIKFDLRGELGVGIELGRQAVPVVANDCIVRTFYFIRYLAIEIRSNDIQSISEMNQINWDNVKPLNNPTIARMLTISTGVFTTIDVGEAVITQKYWVSINYVGVGRFAIAIGEDVSWCLKARNSKRIKQVYEDMKRFAYRQEDNNIYKRIGADMEIDKLGLTIEQTEILYNLEYYKTLNDIQATKQPINKDGIKNLKYEWLEEWKAFITGGFASFLGIEGATLHWYSKQELIKKIEQNEPKKTWFRLVLLEAMLFEPYYTLGFEQDKKGNSIPSKKYHSLQIPTCGYSKNSGDAFLDSYFDGDYYHKGYIKRLRKCYEKVVFEMKEVLKGLLIGGAITAGIAIVTIATAGALAGPIAVALVGSNFAGLSGAALTSACLAYLGGGAIAAGGAGMLGGTAVIVGGGAALGIGAGLGVGGAVGAAGLIGKQNTILQSAKLLVSVREIFLNDEHDTEYSDTVYEQYVQSIKDIENGLTELRLKADVVNGKEKKELKRQIKNAEESVEAMKIARKNLLKFKSSFKDGLAKS